MGFFDKVFKSQRDLSKEEIKETPWHALTEISQLSDLDKESDEKAVVIFKHSTRCGISRMVLNNFEREYDLGQRDDHKLYFLDLLANRDVSNEVSSKYSVQHESPQLIIIKGRKVVHHASHQAVTVDSIKEAV